MFDFVDMFTGGLEFLQLGVQWTYQIAIYYGNMVFDIWALDLAAGSTPRMVVPFADSPAA